MTRLLLLIAYSVVAIFAAWVVGLTAATLALRRHVQRDRHGWMITGWTVLFLCVLAAPLFLPDRMLPLDDVVLRPVLLTLFGTVAVAGILDRAPSRSSKANAVAAAVAAGMTAALICATFYLGYLKSETLQGLGPTLLGFFGGAGFTYFYWRNSKN